MRKNEEPISDIIKKMLAEPKLRDKYQEVLIESIWKNAMGSMIQSYTSKIRFNKGILKISISSASLRQELSMGKEKIINLINEELQEEVVKEVHIW